MKGLERLERPGYPPITLAPGEVSQEAAPMTWTYRAKDGDTGADAAAHLVREACAIAGSDTKYTFRVELNHSQIGTLQGCARMQPDQFPEFKQKNLEDDDPEKTKPGPPPITNFKPPVAYAFLDSTGRVVLRRVGISRVVAPKGSQLALSHDGKSLLFTRENPGGNRSILLYDAVSGKTAELLSGMVQQSYWSPDDSRIAFLKYAGSAWRVWTAPAAAPEQAADLYPGDMLSLEGWSDPHTILATDQDNLYWISDDGRLLQALSVGELYGQQFIRGSNDRVRVNPTNPDLLLVSAQIPKPATGAPTDPRTGYGGGFFLYEVRSKRRVLRSPPELFAENAEWSSDGIQIFFTGRENAHPAATYRIFWDGSEPKRYLTGTSFVVGQ